MNDLEAIVNETLCDGCKRFWLGKYFGHKFCNQCVAHLAKNPLSKARCIVCGAYLLEKDRESHMKIFHAQSPELDRLFPEDDDSQSESEGYHNAH